MSDVKISLEGLSVMIGVPAGRDIHPFTTRSLMYTQRVLAQVKIPHEPVLVANCSVVQWARDEVADVFLKSGYKRLFWIDSDMTWEPDDFMRLLALSQVYDVVCATYPAKIDSPVTFYVNREPDKDMVANEHGLFEVLGVGLGFTIVSRKAMEAIAARSPVVWDEAAQREIREIFRVQSIMKNGRRTRSGEDMAFFTDLREEGFKVWLDPQVDLGHMGMKKYTGSVRDALQLT